MKIVPNNEYGRRLNNINIKLSSLRYFSIFTLNWRNVSGTCFELTRVDSKFEQHEQLGWFIAIIYEKNTLEIYLYFKIPRIIACTEIISEVKESTTINSIHDKPPTSSMSL